MKPLTATKVRRLDQSDELKEWISAEAQDTMAGCADFLQRQRDRMKRVQADRTEQAEKVRTLRK